MTPAVIIKSAAADGVTLSLTPAGTVKASGDQARVKHWFPVIRDQKQAIIKTLLEVSASTGDLGAIREWLTFIGENDPATIACVLEKCRTDSEAMDYFMRRASEGRP